MRVPRIRAALAILAGVVALAWALTGSASAGATESEPTAAWWHLTATAAPTYLQRGGTAMIALTAVNLGDATAVASSNAPVVIRDVLPRGVTVGGGHPGSCQFNGGERTSPLCAIRGPVGVSEVAHACLDQPAQANAERQEVVCTFSEQQVIPFGYFEVQIEVEVSASLPSSPTGAQTLDANEASLSGPGREPPPLRHPFSIEPNGEKGTPFGVESIEVEPEGPAGEIETQAGAHPFQLTTTLTLNRTGEQRFGYGNEAPLLPALPRDIHVDMPQGLVANANKQIIGQCTELEFTTIISGESNTCPPETAVGQALVTVAEPAQLGYLTLPVPVFNLVPARGEPARFGFVVKTGLPVTIDTSIREGNYHAVIDVHTITEAAALLNSLVTIWGVPGDKRHDQSRGWACIAGGTDVEGEPCEVIPEEKRNTSPFLTLPTMCPATPLQASVSAQSWLVPAFVPGPTAEPWALQGCKNVPFAQAPYTPSIALEPDQHTTDTPTGLNVKLTVPQTTTLEREGIAESAIRDTTVTLPAGVQLNPSAATGLAGCSEKDIGFINKEHGYAEGEPFEYEGNPTQAETESGNPRQCPEASKLGTVEINTPDLEQPLKGSVYLAEPTRTPGEPGRNPFDSPFGLYIVVQDPVTGVLVKIAGKVELGEQQGGTLGQITSTFPNAPDLPFEKLEMNLTDGPRASVSTPNQCGEFQTHAAFVGWSQAPGEPAVEPSINPEDFNIGSRIDGAPCANAPAFAPGFQAGTLVRQAGAFTPFQLTITRPPGDQQLKRVSMTLPPGLAGYLSYVTQCPEQPANEGTCGEQSLIGEATATVGLGGSPYTETGGKVYITGPYGGAPFGLSIVLPAKAGPYDFGNVVTRSTLSVDPTTTAITVTSELPTFVDTVRAVRENGEVAGPFSTGVPVQLRQVVVTVQRPGNQPFQFNPTNCTPTQITGTLTGDEGASVPVSEPFQVSGCQNLPFSPTLEAEVNSKYTRVDGTEMRIVVRSTPGQANIAKTKVVFPLQLPSRLTTLQKACLAATFDANPASCSPESIIGTATAHTPVLNSPLTGPAYLVSHGGAEFPDVEFVLQGEGVELVLDGKTNIHNGITSSTFNAVPDDPVTTFEVNLPAGPKSAFTGYEDLCHPIKEVTATKTVTKTVKVKGHKRKRKVRKKVTEKKPILLGLPTILTGQNGDVIEETNPLKVTNCGEVAKYKVKKTKKKTKKHTKKKKAKKHAKRNTKH